MGVRQIGRGGAAGPSRVAAEVLQVAGVGWVCGAMLGRTGFHGLGSERG